MEFPSGTPRGTLLRAGRSFRLGNFLAALFLGLLCTNIRAQSPYQLKAAVLGNIAKFVEWPTNSFSTTNEPVRLGVLGEDPFGADLETILEPIKTRGRSFEVVRSRRVEDLLSCHILFCSDRELIQRMIQKTEGLPILLVGEDPTFLEKGGMVMFHIEDRKVRFAINIGATEEAGLAMRSQLLRLATEVTGKEEAQ